MSESRSACPPVAAIVPVFNEEVSVAEVLSVLRASSRPEEILVVSDGSTDRTIDIVRVCGVKTIHLRQNHGKGMAMALGVAHTHAPVLLFVDGDVLNLSPALLTQLLDPVLSGRVAMNVGIRSRGWLLNSIQLRIGPLLSGLRCMRREVFEAVPEQFLQGYQIETALNWSCRRLGLPLGTTVLCGIKHRSKERKYGFWVGLGCRLAMFLSVFRAFLRLKAQRPGSGHSESLERADLELEYINFQHSSGGSWSAGTR